MLIKLHSQYCEYNSQNVSDKKKKKASVYGVKGITLIKTIEGIWQTVEQKVIDKICMEHDTRMKFYKHSSEILSWQNR